MGCISLTFVSMTIVFMQKVFFCLSFILTLVHTERVAVQRSTKNGNISFVCTVLLSTTAAVLCVNTLLGNSCFHFSRCVRQT